MVCTACVASGGASVPVSGDRSPRGAKLFARGCRIALAPIACLVCSSAWSGAMVTMVTRGSSESSSASSSPTSWILDSCVNILSAPAVASCPAVFEGRGASARACASLGCIRLPIGPSPRAIDDVTGFCAGLGYGWEVSPCRRRSVVNSAVALARAALWLSALRSRFSGIELAGRRTLGSAVDSYLCSRV